MKTKARDIVAGWPRGKSSSGGRFEPPDIVLSLQQLSGLEQRERFRQAWQLGVELAYRDRQQTMTDGYRRARWSKLHGARQVRERDFDNSLAASGMTRAEWQRDVGKMFGLQTGNLSEASVLVAGEWPGAVLGSRRYKCEDCAGFVSLAPSGQEMLRERELRVLCMKCAKKISYVSTMSESDR